MKKSVGKMLTILWKLPSKYSVINQSKLSFTSNKTNQKRSSLSTLLKYIFSILNHRHDEILSHQIEFHSPLNLLLILQIITPKGQLNSFTKSKLPAIRKFNIISSRNYQSIADESIFNKMQMKDILTDSMYFFTILWKFFRSDK